MNAWIEGMLEEAKLGQMHATQQRIHHDDLEQYIQVCPEQTIRVSYATSTPTL